MFFSYDVDEGLEFHKDKVKAEARAVLLLEGHREHAYEGWDEDSVKQICWGQVIESVVETERSKAPEGSEFDEFLNFGLAPVEAQEK